MRLRIRHETSYRYAQVVHASYNEARISPAETPNQFTLEHRVEIEPVANIYRYRDYWGSRVHAFDIHHEHQALAVIGTSVIETAQRSPSLDDSVGWEAVNAPGLIDRFLEYLAPTSATAAGPDIRAAAGDLRREATPAAALQALGTWIRESLEYQWGVTSVSTTATEALSVGHGVCQDFAHIALAALRSAGVPARYVSGYLYPQTDDDDVIGATRRGESHAWIEAWVGDWHPFDPTSGFPVAERHVLVARGRDYSDVAPLKGIYQGGSSHELDVSVELTRVA